MPHNDLSNEALFIEVHRIAGLDAIRALDAMSGQTALYLRLVTSFAKEQQGAAIELQALYTNTDWSTLRRKVHSLKSYAAYIGAYSLASLCANAESILGIEGKQTEVQDTISEVCIILDPLVEQLQLVVANHQETQQVEDFSLAVLRRSLITLLPLLQQSDFAAEQLLQELIQLTKDTAYSAAINDIHDLVDDVEYEVAVKETEKLLDTLM